MIATIVHICLLLGAAAFIWQLAATLAAANRLIDAQRERIRLLEQQLADQQQRIEGHVAHIGELEGRNELLRWAVTRYITSTPTHTRPYLVEALRERLAGRCMN